MHHFGMQSNLVHPSTKMPKLNFGEDDQLVCPKPRRLGPPAPEFLNPLTCKHSHSSHEGSSKIPDMISSKNHNRQEPTSTGCSPSCYCGSPPSRTNNPLVHDIQFIHQMELLSPFTRTNLSDRLGL